MPVKPKSEKAKKEELKEGEFERLVRWRFQALIQIGLAPDQAMSLIETPDIVHSAQNLADKGCPPEMIAAILSG